MRDDRNNHPTAPEFARMSLREWCNGEPAAVLLYAAGFNPIEVDRWVIERARAVDVPLTCHMRAALIEKYGLDDRVLSALESLRSLY